MDLVRSAFNRASAARRRKPAPKGFADELQELLSEDDADAFTDAAAERLFRSVDATLAKVPRFNVKWGRVKTIQDMRESEDPHRSVSINSEAKYPEAPVATAKLRFLAAKMMAKELSRFSADKSAVETKVAMEWARDILQQGLDQKVDAMVAKHAPKIEDAWDDQVEVDTEASEYDEDGQEKDLYQVPSVYLDGKLTQADTTVETKVSGQDVLAVITVKFRVLGGQLVFPGDYEYRKFL